MKTLALFLIVFCTSVFSQEIPETESYLVYQPGDHELLIMPTAYTMDKGSGYFSDYEIFFLNLGIAATPTTQLGGFFLFPITSDFLQTFTFGIKQNYYRSEYFQGALFGTYTIKNGLYTAGNVFSFGRKKTSLHTGFGWIGEKDVNFFLLLLGLRFDFSEKVSGIIEYSNVKEALDHEFGGFISFGIRFRTEGSSWEIAGIRILEDTGDLLMIPYLKATFYF